MYLTQYIFSFGTFSPGIDQIVLMQHASSIGNMNLFDIGQPLCPFKGHWVVLVVAHYVDRISILQDDVHAGKSKTRLAGVLGNVSATGR